MKKYILLVITVMFMSPIAEAQSGISWNMGMNMNTSASGNEHPRLAINRIGNPIVVWHHASRCMFSRWNGTAFTAPVMINPMSMTVAGSSWMGPDIASYGDTVYVVFKQTPEADTSSHIYLVRSFDGGQNFSAPIQVDNIGDSVSRFPTVTTDAGGNPMVAFMKFNSTFGNARWVVTTSADYGSTFSTDVKASGWGGSAAVCDCCPGAIVSSGDTCAVIYRNNNSNIRDSWVGISANDAASFDYGYALEANNWLLMSCPASGPDGTIVGDTLYSVFMNGVSGNDRTYLSKSSVSNSTVGSVSNPAGSIPGLSMQNYPRIASNGNALAIVWKQFVSGSAQLPLLFTNDISNGIPLAYDTVDLNDITNADVALNSGNIFVVWEDDNSGTIKYRQGTFTSPTTIEEIATKNFLVTYPNPVTDKLYFLNYQYSQGDRIEISNAFGQVVLRNVLSPGEQALEVSDLQAGIYFVKVISGKSHISKIVKY